MTMRELEEPRMIYTGPLPPHLMRAEAPPEDPGAEDDFEPRANPPKLLLPITLAASVALVLGVAIGIFAPVLLHGRPAPPSAAPTIQPSAALAPEPIAPPQAAPVTTAADAPAAELQPPAAAAVVPPPAAPIRLSVARLARTMAADPPRPTAKAAVAGPQITAAESDLQNAYQRALGAGTPADRLRSGQIEWLIARQAAANRSPADLAAAYRLRIAQLNAIADDPPH